MSATELSVLFTSKGNLQNELSGLRKELQGVQKEIKAATDAGDTGKVDALSRDYANLSGRIDATRASLRKVNSEIKDTANDGVKSTAKLQGAWKKLQGVMKTPLFTAATVAGVSTSSPLGLVPFCSQATIAWKASTCSATVKSQWFTPRIARCTSQAPLPLASARRL